MVVFGLGTPAALACGLGMMCLRMRYIQKIQELFLAAAKQGGC